MYTITKIELELLNLAELLRVRDAIDILEALNIHEVDIDVRRYVRELVNKKEG